MKSTVVKFMLLTVFFCGYCSAIQLEQGGVEVRLREWAWTWQGERMPAVNAVFDSSGTPYEIRHDQKHGGGGIGIFRPGMANWHNSSMLHIFIDGERFEFLPENNEVIEVEEGGIGKAFFSWENDGVKIALNFLMFPKDDKIFMEVTLEADEQPERVEISFHNHTSGYPESRKFVFYTRERKLEEMREWSSVHLELPAESWLLLTDDNLDFAKNKDSQGPSAIAFHMDGIRNARVVPGPRLANMVFNCDPAVGRYLFALWEFPGRGNAETADVMESLAKDAAEKMEILRGL